MENITSNKNKVLYLTLKKQWFDLIDKGIKTEEYREVKQYWIKRLEGRSYDIVEFRNGYQKDAPKMSFKIRDITKSTGNIEWGAVKDVVYFVIKLGEKLS